MPQARNRHREGVGSGLDSVIRPFLSDDWFDAGSRRLQQNFRSSGRERLLTSRADGGEN